MAILHSIWTPAAELLLWGEVWRRTPTFAPRDWMPTPPHHPLCLDPQTVLGLIRSLPELSPLAESIAAAPVVEIAVPLPTIVVDAPDSQLNPQLTPLHSGQDSGQSLASDPCLYPWQITAHCLAPDLAFELLNRLPLHLDESENEWLGGDLRYWSHVTRWILDLWSQSKFIPTLEIKAEIHSETNSKIDTDGSVTSRWQARLDAEGDRLRLDRFCQQMPGVVQWLGVDPSQCPDAACPLPESPHRLLYRWIHQMTDRGIRQSLQSNVSIATEGVELAPMFQQFWASLTQPIGSIAPTPETPLEEWQRWSQLLHRWANTAETLVRQPFRPALRLEPPQTATDPWILHYGLYGQRDRDDRPVDAQLDDSQDNSQKNSRLDNPQTRHTFIPAAEVWQGTCSLREGYGPAQAQTDLLRGLGQAVRLYPVLETSLDAPEPQQHQLSTAEAYTFIKTIAPRLEEQGLAVLLPAGLASGRGVANRLGLQVKAELAPTSSGGLGLSSLLQFGWELCLGGQTFSKAAFDRLVAQETPLVNVNGEWLELRPQDIAAARDFFKRRKDQPNLSLEDALRLNTGDVQTLSKLPVVNFESLGALQALMTTLSGSQPVESLPPPPGFQGQLRPYQERGAGWLEFLHRWNLGACLADDMGLGKTIQFIAFLLNLYQKKQLKDPYLLICPTSVLTNWEREVKRFAPDLKCGVHHGEKRSKGKTFKSFALKYHLIITSYSLVHRDLADFKTVSWQGIVLDEAQNIKNAEAKQSISVRELTIPSRKDHPLPFRIALTGTPVENRLTELWSIMEFLNPGYLGTKAFFQRRFMMPIERYGDRDSLHALRSLVQPFILRRLKTDRTVIQDLPEKQETTVFCGLSPEQGDLYQKTVDETLETIEAAEGIEKHGLILALLTKLKQICNHPSLFLKEKVSKNDRKFSDHPVTDHPGTDRSSQEYRASQEQWHTQFPQRSAKVQRLESILDELLAEGDRALLFTQFVEWGHLLQTYFEHRYQREILFLHGGTRKADRDVMIDRFQEDPHGPRLFILSLKAGGVGLNLTRANHVFHVDRWWNPAVENQATDRAFRIGQTRKVQVHKFVCSGTLEERIHDIIESKKALADQVVGTGENWLTQLDGQQLRDLLLLNRDAIES